MHSLSCRSEKTRLGHQVGIARETDIVKSRSLGAALGGLMGGVLAMRAVVAHRIRGRAQYPPPQSLIVEPETDASVLRNPNGALLIRWRGEANVARIYMGKRPEEIDRDAPVATVSQANEVTLAGLDPNSRNYFEIAFGGGPMDGKRVIVAERILPLRGGVNFRDIGGYRTREGLHTRWGRVFRSGALNDLTTDDLNYLQDMGLRLICDLRTAVESRKYHDRLPDATVEYWWRPIFTDEESSGGIRQMIFNLWRLNEMVTESYTYHMIDRKPLIFGEILRRFAAPASLPAVIHCTAGKDRTGVAVGLLLSALGVPDETIIADYSLSNLYFESLKASLMENIARLRIFGITVDDLMPLLTANPTTMRALLDHLRARYGSTETYLRAAAGIDDATLRRLREALLE